MIESIDGVSGSMTPDPLILACIILIARIGETSLKTVRQLYVNRGYKYLAAGLGTGEMAVWLLSTGLVITNLSNIPGIIAYIAGYAIGTILGLDIEDRLKVGNAIVRIIVREDPESLIQQLREHGYGVTRLEGSGSFGTPVSVLLVLVPRRVMDDLVLILKNDYPEAIFSIEDIRSVGEDRPLFFRAQDSFFRRLVGR
jgi:uncharacterized protein YebE (UPF0316 family)